MKPHLNIKLQGTGGYRKNRYRYGGSGGVILFTYDSHVVFDDPNVNYEGAFAAINRYHYGDHLCYGGDGGTFFETASQPTITLINRKINTQNQVNNVPTLRII